MTYILEKGEPSMKKSTKRKSLCFNSNLTEIGDNELSRHYVIVIRRFRLAFHNETQCASWSHWLYYFSRMGTNWGGTCKKCSQISSPTWVRNSWCIARIAHFNQEWELVSYENEISPEDDEKMDKQYPGCFYVPIVECRLLIRKFSAMGWSNKKRVAGLYHLQFNWW